MQDNLAQHAARFKALYGSGIVILSDDQKVSYLKVSDIDKLGLDKAGEDRVRKLVAQANRLTGSFTLRTGSHNYRNVAPNPSAYTYLVGNTPTAPR